MFESISMAPSDPILGLTKIFNDDKNIKKIIKDIRISLLEADVALPVVKKFIKNLKEKSIGKKINKNLTPEQEFIKIIRSELIITMGEKNHAVNFNTQPPAIMIFVGIQGVGKTTSLAKLGNLLFNKFNKKILTTSVDVYRPAAIKQLEILSKNANIDFFHTNINENPISIINDAINHAKINFYDILLIDTAGRSHIDEMMMKEIKKIYFLTNPIETLFVVDAMMGQDAANIANSFNKAIPITGIILTKVDGDTRGGAALSMCYITKKPIKFIGVGEKINDLEPFYPDRLAGRILGMGDILSLIDNIEDKVDKNQIRNLTNKLKKDNDFDFNDFLNCLNQLNNMGGMSNFLEKIPQGLLLSNNIFSKINDKDIVHIKAMINSMTHKERLFPHIIKGSRKIRIVKGSGMKIQNLNQLLRQFNNIQYMFKKVQKDGISKMIRNIKNMILK